MRLLLPIALGACLVVAPACDSETPEGQTPDAAAEVEGDTTSDEGGEPDVSVDADEETVEDAAQETVEDVDDDVAEVIEGNVYETTIGGWTMQPGKETTRCVVKRLNNTETIRVKAIRTTLSAGSHHLIVYKSDATTEQADPFKCSPFTETLGGGTVPLMITQIGEETLQFPDGVVFELEPNQMIRLEAHYLNYYQEPIETDAKVEFIESDDPDTQLADLLFYGTADILVPPQSDYQTPWTYMDVPNGVKMFAITGHTHQYGVNVEVTRKTKGSDDDGLPLYPADQTFQWDEAPIVRYDPPVEFGPGQGFRMRCTWDNTSDNYLFFGESANQEMCFLWAYYYPSQGYVLCAEGLFGCPNDN